jgi:hypothetical protein
MRPGSLARCGDPDLACMASLAMGDPGMSAMYCDVKPPYPYQLLWLLSLTLSCPLHGCLLEPRPKAARHTFPDWERRPPTPRPVPVTALSMDKRTWHAMTTGWVELPRRQVHAAIWFRLIRTIIDELGATLSECRTAGPLIKRFWKEAGYPQRVGPRSWQPHEGYPPDAQICTLEATATTIHLLESKALTGQGREAALFLPPPSTPLEERQRNF